MSDFRAIADVSRAIRALLEDRMTTPAADVTVTIAPPDVTVAEVATDRVNLYLYRVSESPALKNQEIPGQGHPAAFGHPPLSLDLHYLVTAYANNDTVEDADLTAQELLGDTMQVLHDNPVIPGDLLLPNLRHAFERIKISLQPAPMEELASVWNVYPDTDFRRSAAYQVSVVQIESRRPRRHPRPVETRQLHLTLSHRPEIHALYRTSPLLAPPPIGDSRVGIGQGLSIEGRNFTGERVLVRLGGLEPIGVTPQSPELITIELPDDEYPDTRPIPEPSRLQPGPQTVEVLTERTTEVVAGGLGEGETLEGQSLLVSNQAVFMLVPAISSIDPLQETSEGMFRVGGTRLYRPDLKSYVLLGDLAIPVHPPRGDDLWDEPTATSVQVPLTMLSTVTPPLPPDVYPVRIMVNGAQSLDELTFELEASP